MVLAQSMRRLCEDILATIEVGHEKKDGKPIKQEWQRKTTFNMLNHLAESVTIRRDEPELYIKIKLYIRNITLVMKQLPTNLGNMDNNCLRDGDVNYNDRVQIEKKICTK